MASTRHITLPRGFAAGAAACGIKPSGRHDIAVVAGEQECSAAVVMTRNQITGAPVQYNREVLPRSCGKMRAIVVNSGCSNVCTGAPGVRDAKKMAGLTAEHLGCDQDSVIVASTGVIGQRLDMNKIGRGIAESCSRLGTGNDDTVARAIMTTDTVPKSFVASCVIGRKNVTIAGIAKGAGMIAPSMATMISVITTDAAVSPRQLHSSLRKSASTTFNAVTVDSDQSTSDIVAILASGAAGNPLIKSSGAALDKFTAMLTEVCGKLARMIASDGEGATRLVEVCVSGAVSNSQAEILSKSVANSPLVKTAINGNDPNWGRIAMALGKCPRSQARVDPDLLTIRLCGVKVFAKGRPCVFDRKKLSRAMNKDAVTIDCSMGLGKGSYTALTCDLSREYISINADYTT
jgi:glutamate N-acetyltransferase/amino-acid N-acetyltransferase